MCVFRCLAFLDQISENNGDFLTRETLIRTVVSICIENVSHLTLTFPLVSVEGFNYC